MSEDYVKDVFDTYWSESNTEIKSWNYLSQTIFEILCTEIGEPEGKRIAEIGCGSGRISARLASVGAQVTAFDISSEALNISRNMFQRMTLSGRHIKGTMFHIGVRSGVYDVVWNAGVLEHFSEAEQIQALGEMARICKEDGLIITLHPYAGSMLYRSGKKILEKLGRWKYGRLAPIRSMRRVASANGLTLVREYPDDFFIQLVEGPRRFIPKLGPLFADALGYLVIRTRHPGLFSVQVAIDRFFAKRLGGYLIVSVMKKQSAA